MDHVCVVLNPTADRGRAGRRLHQLRNALSQNGTSVEVRTTERPGHAVQIAKEAVQAGAQVVVAAGGDGTAHEVAQAVVGTDAALGIIPIGSGNDFVRMLGIPKGIDGAVSTILRGRTRMVDVAEVNGRFGLNAFGMGIDGQIAASFQRMRMISRSFAYLCAVLLEIVRFRGFRVHLQCEDWHYDGKLVSLSVMNGRFSGGGLPMAQHARIDDGVLDVGLIGDYPHLMRFILFPKLRTGSHFQLARVHAKQTQLVTIQSERPLRVHMDGELLPELVQNVQVAIKPLSLRVIA